MPAVESGAAAVVPSVPPETAAAAATDTAPSETAPPTQDASVDAAPSTPEPDAPSPTLLTAESTDHTAPPAPEPPVPSPPVESSDNAAPAPPAAPPPPTASAEPPETTAATPSATGEALAKVEPQAAPPQLANLPPPVVPPPATAAASAEMTLMLQRGDQLFATGDIVSARQFYERAATSGNAAALCGVGKSFDPLVLRDIGVLGLVGDAATAILWYGKAAEAGSEEASLRLKQLAAAHRLDSQKR